MKKQILSLLIFLITICTYAGAQDTLPEFSVRNVGHNRTIIDWINTFSVIKQISIQRSFDSLTGFKTILTVTDPTAPQNGYMDTKATNDHMFYRLYILLDKGNFLFSDAKKPFIDTNSQKQLVIPRFTNAADSISWLKQMNKGKTDSLGVPDILTKGNNKPDVFMPSRYVSAFRNGYVHVSLPDDEKKYNLKFFEEDGTFLFELKDIKEKNSALINLTFIMQDGSILNCMAMES